MTTLVADVRTGVGLLIDGAVVPGAAGSYPARQRVTVRRPGQGSWGASA